MKRDKQLILKILRWVRETADGKHLLEAPDCRDFEPDVVRYHVRLCLEAGFIDAAVLSGGDDIRIRNLTWAGHEHLERHFDC